MQPDFAVHFFDKMIGEDTKYIFIVEENGDALGYIFFKLVDKSENPFVCAHRFFEFWKDID